MLPQASPVSPTETKLVAIWSEVLGVDDAKPTDTFTSSGGESILAMQCLSRIRTIFGVEISPVILFAEDPTIAELARLIDEKKYGQ